MLVEAINRSGDDKSLKLFGDPPVTSNLQWNNQGGRAQVNVDYRLPNNRASIGGHVGYEWRGADPTRPGAGAPLLAAANDKLFKDLQQSKSPWSATPTVNATNSGGFAHVTVERDVGKNTSVGGHVGYEWAGPTPTRQYGAPYGGVHIKYRF
ncbi:hypothetical protein BKA93DRAFT_828713 [Sparassis latifolia]